MKPKKKKTELRPKVDAQAMDIIDWIRVIYLDTAFADWNLGC